MNNLSRHRNLITTILVFVLCTAVNICLAYATDHGTVDMEVRKISSVFSVVLSFGYIVIYFFICLILRLKKQKAILSGLLLYQLLGLISFVIHLILLMAGEESFLSIISTKIFYWWSLPYYEATVWFMNMLHFHIRYVMMIFVGMNCYVTAKCLYGINIDKQFEKKIQEKKESEAKAEEESKKHRITSAKEVEEYNANFNK
ncbi:MAG: hypothetical protein E7388_01235 [Ruminococcaceae bacterium]|nr:hypothetical protein [Oscillospiraceae bacterium]